MLQKSKGKGLIVGCSLLVLLFGVALVIGGFLFFREFKAGINDPDQVARTLLGTQQFPAGYKVNVALSIPFLSDTVILSEHDNDEAGQPPGFGEGYGFFYTRVKVAREKTSTELEDFFEGRAHDASVLSENHINVKVDPEQILARGTLEVNGYTTRYFTTASLNSDDLETEGLSTLMLFSCPTDQQLRFAIWFSGEPLVRGEDGSPQTAGTQGDPEVIRTFLGHFQFCTE